jgi:hypothetical protein
MFLTALSLSLAPALFQDVEHTRLVRVRPVSPQEAAEVDEERGMIGVILDKSVPVIRGFIERGTAEEAGLMVGDRITKVGKKKIDDTEGLSAALGNRTAGDKVKVWVMRGEERVKVSVTLTAAKATQRVEASPMVKTMVLHVEDEHDEKGRVIFDDSEWRTERNDMIVMGDDHFIYQVENVERGSSHDEEHVDFWESEDGSRKELNVHMVGEGHSPDRLEEIMREHGIDLHGFDRSDGEVEIRVEIESDDDGPYGVERLLEVLNRPGNEDLDALENNQRRRMMQGQQRRGSAQMRGNGNNDRGQDRRMRGNGNNDRGQDRRMRGNGNNDRGQGRWMRGNGNNDRGQGRWMRGNEGNDRDQDRRMRGNEGNDRDQDRRMRGDQGRDRGEGPLEHGEHHPDGERHGDENHGDENHGDENHGDENRDGEHHDGDGSEHMDSLWREFEQRMEEHHQHGEEISRGFDDAMREMEEHREERAQSLHEERDRVIEELHQRIEEVSNGFEQAFRELEEGHGDRMQQLHEEREHRFEELRARGEEMSHQFEDRSHELEARSEREHD